jgi:hypothetical protein|tara:strand:+ start:291 stop:503 length:213 start_codon:yes stop_codon:yes gene_type:complete
MKNKKEANLVSFKILLTKDNKIVTEFSMLPEEEVDNIFNIDERAFYKSLLKKGKEKLNLHKYFEREINSL